MSLTQAFGILAKKRKLPFSDEKDSKRNEKKIITRLLVNTYPEIYKEIHPTKNGDIDTKSLSVKSKKKIWWKCSDHKGCHKHEWKASVTKRIRGNNCIWCFGKKYCGCPLLYKTRKLQKGSMLFRDKYPHLVCEILEELNPDLNLHMISQASDKAITWKCRFAKCPHHIWVCGAAYRAQNNCPFCRSMRVRSNL